MFSEARPRPRLVSTSFAPLLAPLGGGGGGVGISPGTFVSAFGSVRVAVVRRVFFVAQDLVHIILPLSHEIFVSTTNET